MIATHGVVVWKSAYNARTPRRIVPAISASRPIREEAENLCERVLLGLGLVIDRTAHVRVDIRAAEFFLGQLLADAPFDHRRSRDKHLTRPADHHREMRRRHPRRRYPRPNP